MTDLLIDTYGTKVGSSGERIVLSFPNVKEKKEYPIRRLSKIAILRPATITTHAVRLALEHDVDIVYLGCFGKPVGRIFSSQPKGIANLRRAQLAVSVSEQSFFIARSIVKRKCLNQLSYLEYLSKKYQKNFSKELLQARTILETIDFLPISIQSRSQLLGVEGYVADRYFRSLRSLFEFPGRRPQGRDKFNSALNYGYGILYNEVERVCLYVGLDPYLGLCHSERYGKPSLVLDLVEEFRLPVIDSIIIPFFIDKKLGKNSHYKEIGLDNYQLSSQGKAILVKGVMENLNRKTIWCGKNYTFKQVIENQIRALARRFVGREVEYVPFDSVKFFTNE